ncbi:hypothetical protein AMJ86_05235 [bacterium SM23_57]|nr:MAG: hypothetical protein AMJ86_05235 [bacterium SM23_57]
MPLSNSIITLTTDFGVRDGFPAAMYGVILSVNPQVRIVDLCHAIHPGDIAHGAYILTTVAPYFPAGTIHLAIVDPGVGTKRHILVLRTQEQVFIAPDNGLLGYILQQNPDAEVRYLENPKLWLEKPSFTFHGRDIMAPAAARLAMGIPFSEVGPVANFWEPAPLPPMLKKEQYIQGYVIHIDHFGNLITNIPGEYTGTLTIRDHRIETRAQTFSDGTPGEPVMLVGSSGCLEIVVKEDSAANLLKVSVGDTVNLMVNKM